MMSEAVAEKGDFQTWELSLHLIKMGNVSTIGLQVLSCISISSYPAGEKKVPIARIR